MESIKVFIADDHALVRNSLCRLFEAEPDIEVVGKACCTSEMLQKIRGTTVDVCVVDLSMPDNEGVEIVKLLSRTLSDAAVMVLSMHEDGALASRAIKAGAAGYLTKDIDMDVLLLAVRRLANRGKFIDPKLVDKLVFDVVHSDDKPVHTSLSDREYEIFKMLVNGMTVTDIAKKLHLSSKTVSTYKQRLMQKMQVNSVPDLVRYSVKHNCH